MIFNTALKDSPLSHPICVLISCKVLFRFTILGNTRIPLICWGHLIPRTMLLLDRIILPQPTLILCFLLAVPLSVFSPSIDPRLLPSPTGQTPEHSSPRLLPM